MKEYSDNPKDNEFLEYAGQPMWVKATKITENPDLDFCTWYLKVHDVSIQEHILYYDRVAADIIDDITFCEYLDCSPLYDSSVFETDTWDSTSDWEIVRHGDVFTDEEMGELLDQCDQYWADTHEDQDEY